jgi:hypothetical protein
VVELMNLEVEAIQPIDLIRAAVRKQGYKIMETEQLLTEAYQLFQDIAQSGKGWGAKVERQGRDAVLQHLGHVVCKVSASYEHGSVYVGDGEKCDDFHGSTFKMNNSTQMVNKIQDLILRYCGQKGIKEL